MQTALLIILILTEIIIILKQKRMNTLLDSIKADIQSAQDEEQRVATEVVSLHAQILTLSEFPTADDIANLKSKSAALVSSLKGIDLVEIKPMEVVPANTEPEVVTPLNNDTVTAVDNSELEPIVDNTPVNEPIDTTQIRNQESGSYQAPQS
jgi:hypothetical protein